MTEAKIILWKIRKDSEDFTAAHLASLITITIFHVSSAAVNVWTFIPG